MKIKSVKIGGSKHKVIYCAIENSYGMYDKDERIIYINKNLKGKKEEELQTLLHEIIHGYQCHFQINEFLGLGESEDELKPIDNLVELIAKGFIMMVRENPELLKKLNKIAKG